MAFPFFILILTCMGIFCKIFYDYGMLGMRRCYSSFFGWVAAEGLIDRNPCAALAQIKCRKTVKKSYSAMDMEK